MRRDEIADLVVVAVVAEERSFTKAAKRLGLAQSALSQIVRRVEERLDIRLLSRSTRSVSPTEAGERLLAAVGPMLRDIELAVGALGELRDRPSGLIRITTVEHAAKTILAPVMNRLLKENPDVQVEIDVDHALVDIIARRYDAGIRLGGEIAKDMIAMRISEDIPMAIVAAPSYMTGKAAPERPKHLVDHNFINFRLPTSSEMIGWKLIDRGKEVIVRGNGQMIVNTIELLVQAAVDGHGLAYVHYDQVAELIQQGRLVHLLKQYTPKLPGYYLYYPNRRKPSSAFSVLLECLRDHRSCEARG